MEDRNGTPVETKDITKPDDYTYQQIRRVLTNYKLSISENIGKNEAVELFEKIDKMVDSWNDDGLLEGLQKHFQQLIKLADGRLGQSDKDVLSIHEETISINKEEFINFKDSLMQPGNFLGDMVGLVMLYKSTYKPGLLQEPIVVKGIDTVVRFLSNENQEDLQVNQSEEFRQMNSNMQEFRLKLIESNVETLASLSKLRSEILKD